MVQVVKVDVSCNTKAMEELHRAGITAGIGGLDLTSAGG